MSLVDQLETGHGDWFPALVEHSPNLVVVIDGLGAVSFANPATLAMFGVSQEQAIGASAFRFVYPDDVDRLKVRFTELISHPGSSNSDTVRFVSATGDVRVLQIVATNLLDDDVISGIVINGHDVTERDQYLKGLEATLDAVTVSVSNMVELRDPYTAGHQRQVAQIAGAIARNLDLPDDEVKGIEVASTIHDIGKIAIPAEILTRPGRLSVAEFEIVKTHSRAGHDIVADVPFPWPVAEMILQHHERLDGSGYPRGLTGEDILMGSRIVAIADVVSAISSHRPYRPALGMAAALDELRANRGRLYDDDAVDSMLQVVCRVDFRSARPLADEADH
ncbi:MAG: HD domain-containing phosphohydrolase [Acidimicrobiales bacterium]|jgi:PAS domain S-box-containing protein